MIRRAVILFFVLACSAPALAGTAGDRGFDPGTVDYRVSFAGKEIAWREFAFFLMPEELVPLRIYLEDGVDVQVEHIGGKLDMHAPDQGVWTAPREPGLYSLTIRPDDAAVMQLNLLVKVPMSEVSGESINGYRIGRYPKRPLNGNSIYLPPPGLVEVTAELVDLPVSPHFTLGQFLCKQQPDHWPKYLVLREALVAKLEIILEEVNQRGIRTDSFVIMSGYRTPWYNRAIGNGQYSRHVWGGAADIFIDTNGDGRMDDLNGSGRSELGDARLLLSIIDDIYRNGDHARLHGGLGLYGPRPHRGPFVHVDARGHEARWELP